MTITRIEARQLRNMENHEGLVIQGCGGDLQEWVDGINEMLTEADILKNGSRFEKCYAFENENLTCMLFPFEDVQLDIGKLAMSLILLYSYILLYKPECPLIGQNGNVFNLMGIASKTLKENDMADEAKEMYERITSSGSYDEALCIISEYVEITSIDEYEEETEEMGMEMM